MAIYQVCDSITIEDKCHFIQFSLRLLHWLWHDKKLPPVANVLILQKDIANKNKKEKKTKKQVYIDRPAWK